eukprot:TRINITY_DN3297_c0_g1_i5.p3 TRINITY_DN3297_c0_g1~~TRINITY_DN3297_c0_g1_i5.p3  ORF type:complete len:275 (-),score=66.96 TRINITY_DN3297_c0_g1_i5:56-880(-)
MLRTWTGAALAELGDNVAPVVWSYQENCESGLPPGMWDRYRAAFGQHLFGAGCFKGAQDPHTNIVPLQKHYLNTLSWLGRSQKTPLSGFFLTGWSRFDHCCTLCELLPAALPSLCVCLAVLRHGSGVQPGSVLASLGLSGSLDLVALGSAASLEHPPALASLPIGRFPGAEIFALLGKLEWAEFLFHKAKAWQVQFVPVVKRDKLQRRNPSKTELVAKNAAAALALLETVATEMPRLLAPLFYSDDVDEWMANKVEPVLLLCRQLVAHLHDDDM